MSIAELLISPELKQKIIEAIKTRSSLEILLQDENFIGTRESIIELLHILRETMGNRMMLEFIFSSHIAIWEEYRKMIDKEIWLDLAEAGQFNSDHYTLLGTSLIYRDQSELGKEFLETAAANAFDTKTFIAVADAMHSHLKNNQQAKLVLTKAAEHCKNAEHYSQIAEAFMAIAEDHEMSRAMFSKAIELATVAHEFMEIAAAIARTLKDKEWAQTIFNKHTTVPTSGTPIEMLAEEAFQDELTLIP